MVTTTACRWLRWRRPADAALPFVRMFRVSVTSWAWFRAAASILKVAASVSFFVRQERTTPAAVGAVLRHDANVLLQLFRLADTPSSMAFPKKKEKSRLLYRDGPTVQ
jgi:hypothetical protein